MPRNPRGAGPEPLRNRRPASSPEAQEARLVSLAFNLAEERILNGTATSQEVTHFLKLGSSREALEQERIRHENELMEVKREAMASQQRTEELYKNALDAMRAYSGQDTRPPQDEYDA